MANRNRQELHDLLLEQMPEGASHEACSLCHTTIDNTEPEGGTRVSKTYTEEDLQTAVMEKTAELAAKVTALENAAQMTEASVAVSAAKAETAAELEDLRSKLDIAALAAQTAKGELEAYKTELEELAAAEVTAKTIAGRREERLAKVKEFAFTDEYLEANADRFAAMSDEDFDERLKDWAVVAPKRADDKIPAFTALTAARESSSSISGMNEVRTLMRAGLTGTDPRNL